MNKTRYTPYTLVELLVVVAVMALIMSIALPSFSKMAKGQGPKNATRTILATLKASRSYAITERQYVAVLFPTTNSLGSSFAYNSYRACLVVKTTAGEYEFRSWIDGEPWKQLPVATIFRYDKKLKVVGTDVQDDEDNASNIPIQINKVPIPPDDATTTNDVYGVVFTPSGKITKTSIILSIYEGTAMTAPSFIPKNPANHQMININLLGFINVTEVH